ncbi:MAG: hypothetical protein GY795_42055 [Desulfobacterales bacterium]|nr:hypothetical protein [Desulfobacterales bacterium]
MNYCCDEFKRNIEDYKVIEKAADIPDETEWYISGGGHIYYCPFCGTHIKGNGFGAYDEKNPPK